MAPTDRQQAELTSSRAPSERGKFALLGLGLVAGLGLVVAAYVACILPAQQHLAALERQCSELTRVVQQLQGQQVAAQEGLQLLELLAGQAEAVEAAEDALEGFLTLRTRLVQECQAVATTTTALEQLHAARQLITVHNQGLEQMHQDLQQMADMEATLSVSGDLAAQAANTLNALTRRQRDLTGEITTLGKQLTTLENAVLSRSGRLPQAEQTLVQMETLCERIAATQDNVTTARQQLVGWERLHAEILSQAAGWEEAKQLLTSLWDLRDAVLRSQEIITATQHMMVEVMLMEPAMERALTALRPFGDVQRTSQREAQQQLPLHRAGAVKQSPWPQVFRVAVAMLTNLVL